MTNVCACVCTGECVHALECVPRNTLCMCVLLLLLHCDEQHVGSEKRLILALKSRADVTADVILWI